MTIYTRVRRLLSPLKWEWERMRYPKGRWITLNNDIRLRVDPAVNVGRRATFEYEIDFHSVIMKEMNPSSIFFDIGANQGLYSIPSAIKGARVHAFEPAPAAVQILQRQIQCNNLSRKVRIISAVMAETSDKLLPLHVAPTAVGWASAAYRPKKTMPVYTSTLALDDYCRREQVQPTIIKIDIEGLEFAALRGAMESLLRHGPTVFCAMHPDILKSRGESVEGIIQWMESCGYRAFNIHGGSASGGEEEMIFRAKTQR